MSPGPRKASTSWYLEPVTVSPHLGKGALQRRLSRVTWAGLVFVRERPESQEGKEA